MNTKFHTLRPIASLLTLLLFNIGIISPTLAIADSVLPQDQQAKFLKVDEAFQGSLNLIKTPSIETASQDQSLAYQISNPWLIAEGYYLYKDRFKVKPLTEGLELGEIEFDVPGIVKEDEYFGEVSVFKKAVTLTIPIISAPPQFSIQIKYQGCAEAGLCYLPEKLTQAFQIPKEVLNTSPHPLSESESESKTVDTLQLDRHDATSLHQYLQQGSLLPQLLLFFIFGIGLTFTPCVLPMIPILSGVIAGQQQPLTTRKGFILSSSYVMGMALTFALIGLIVGLTGAKIQVWMQNTYVLSGFAVIFVLLAFSMFGFYELQLPRFLQDKLGDIQQKQQGGHLWSVFLMGALSAVVASPCVSAPLAGALLYVTNEGSALIGALILFALGLGMGAPLIVIGTSGANILPKAGAWMDQVKAFFGVLLLGVGLWFLRTVLPGTLLMWLWAGLLICTSVYFGAFNPSTTGMAAFRKGICLMAFLYGVLLVLGASSGATNPLKPLVNLNKGFSQFKSADDSSHPSAHQLSFETIRSITQLESALTKAKTQNTPMMIDYYADWCIACVEMEHGAFQDPNVVETLKSFSLLQVDLTDNPEAQKLLDRFDLFGPPSILFFDKMGVQIPNSAVMGEMSGQRFLEHLKSRVFSVN